MDVVFFGNNGFVMIAWLVMRRLGGGGSGGGGCKVTSVAVQKRGLNVDKVERRYSLAKSHIIEGWFLL